jgi:hypothetical protein
MKIKILLVGAAALLILLASAWAADVTGKWVAQVQGRNGMTENTFNLKVDGTALTGSLTTPQGETQISEGKVNGDEISFVIVRKFGENEMKILYKGKVSGDEIKFAREYQGGMGGGRGPGGPGGGGPGAGGPGGGGPGGGGMGGNPPEIIAKRVK